VVYFKRNFGAFASVGQIIKFIPFWWNRVHWKQ